MSVQLEVSAARFGVQSQKNILIAKGKVVIVPGPPPCSILCLSHSVPFQTLLLQLLKYFTKQIWLFIFYLYYPCGHLTPLSEEKKKLLNPTR